MSHAESKKYKSVIATRARNINIVLFALGLSIMTAIAFMIVKDINNEASLSLAGSHSVAAAKEFYVYISRYLDLAQKASSSKAVTTWFGDEENPAKKAAAHDEMLDYFGQLPSARLYLAIHGSLNEYVVESGTSLKVMLPYDRLDPADDENNVWYYECLVAKNDYVLKIDYDKLTREWRLWINHKVMTDGNYEGIFCAGLPLEALLRNMFWQYDAKSLKGYVIDKNGVIQLDSSLPEAFREINKTHIQNESSDPAFALAIDSYLEKISGLFDRQSRPEVLRLAEGPYGYASVAPIDMTDWSVVVFFNSDPLFGVKNILPLSLALLFALLLYVGARDFLIGRLVFTPLNRLIKSVAETGPDGADIFGRDRDDEIGELARTIQDAGEHLRAYNADLLHATGSRQRQARLLHAVNGMAAVLLAAADDEKFEASLLEGMELMGLCVDVDRVYIWKNEIINDALYYVRQGVWRRASSREDKTVHPGMRFPYSRNPEWEEKFLRGECVNGPLSGLTLNEQDILRPFGIKSALMIPVHLQGHLWGFVSFDDCHQERTFTEDEISILRSGSLMMVNALNRHEQTHKIRLAHEHTKVILDTMPFMCHLWDKDLKIFACNEETLKAFNVNDKQDFLGHFFDFSPEYQPDGRLSSDKAAESLNKAFKDGRHTVEWMHQAADGTPMPFEITFVRLNYGDDYAVAAYGRDLREHRQMMSEIERRDSLLHTVNRTAAVLLAPADEIAFEASLLEGMEIIGRYVDVDRICIWRNETINGVFGYVNQFHWLNDTGPWKKPVAFRPYRDLPGWESKFLRNEYLNGPISGLGGQEQAILGPQDVKTLLAIPLHWQNQFYGFFSFDDCRRERAFTEDEVDILRSAGLMLVSALVRQEQAAKIREAHERANLLLNAMPFIAQLWDKDGRLFDCSEEAVTRFNLKDKQEFIDRFSDLSPKYQPDGRLSSEMVERHLAEAFENSKCVFEWTHQLLDGTPIPSEITMVRVGFEGDYALAGYVRDLREHKQMMKEIERRGSLLDAVNQAAAILLKSEADEFERNVSRCMGLMGEAVGVDRVCIWKNSIKDDRLCCTQIYEWLGDAVSQMNNERTMDIPYEENIPGWEEKLSRGECLTSLVRDMSPREQAQLFQQDIRSIFVAPLFVRDQFWGFIGFDDCHRDRTFSETEQAILRSGGLLIANALLRNENVREMIRLQADLENALRQAREANNAKSRFLASMSHEMRTPLNAIIGLSELALESEEAESANPNLENIHNAGLTLLSTVNDILDISKIEAGKFELVPAEYDIPSLINDAITQCIMHIDEKPISFILDIDGNLPARLCGDELRIKQIFNNLLSNAFKYTREGTVELSMSCARQGDAVWMTLRVRDTGIGIRPEDFDRLFAEYIQLDQNSNRQIGGTGLGLPITKKLAEMMDGSVTAESEYGKGSIFTVKFRQKFVSDEVIGPFVANSLKNFRYLEQRRHQNARLVRLKLPYARVLVVDDVATNLDVARGMMKPYGMRIDCVTSGQAAIEALRDETIRYNAVFMDHMMPGMDGLEAARIIREEIGTEYARDIPLIALTANAIVGNEAMFLSRGFQAFLSKPIEMGRLDAVIRQWVRDKKFEDNETPGQWPEKTAVPFPGQVEGIDLQKGFERFDCDLDSFMEVLRSYATNTRPLLEAARKVSEENLADYAVIVHGIKGSSRGISADLAGDQAEVLEKAAQEGDIGFVTAHNTAFIEALEKLLVGLESLIRRTDLQKPKKDKPDSLALKKLLSACEAYDMDAVDAALAEIEAFEYEADEGLAAWLRENVDRMNLTQIKEKLSALDLTI